MAKITLQDLTNLQNEATAVSRINSNNALIEAAIEEVLSRDGTAPNEMNADLDMNSNRIYNLPLPVANTEPIRKNEYDQELGSILVNAERAEAAADLAESYLDQFQSSWLGAQASDPSVDLNGDALTAGDTYYNTTNGKIRYYTGSAWSDFPAQTGLITRQTFIATAGQTTFTVSGGYIAPYLMVFYNGVLLYPTEYTATNGTDVVLASGAIVDSEISTVKFDAFSVANALVAANNLSDVANVATARTNLGLGSLAVKNTVATADIDNDAVTFAKIQTITDNRLVGRSSGSDGDLQHITVGTGLSLSGGTLVSTAAAPINLDPGYYITGTVAANALTIALKTPTDNDPSVGEPITFKIRSATATNGEQETLTLTSATSLVVSSGSTLGTVNNRPFRLRVVLFNDSGTPRLGVVNPRASSTIAAVRNNLLASSTAEGGAGGADSGTLFYTGTAVTSKPYIVLGYLDWSSGLAAVGTWSSGPTKVQVQSAGVPFTGDILQSQQFFESVGSVSSSTSYATVNSTQQNITPLDAMSGWRVHYSAAVVVLAGGAGTNTQGTVNIFRGATDLGALQIIGNTSGSGTNVNQYGCFSRTLIDFPGDTGATNYTLQHKRDAGGNMTTSNIYTEVMEISL